MPRWQVIAHTLAWITGLALILFSSAGRLDLAPFWEYLAVFGGLSLAGAILIDPALARERMRPGGKRMDWKYSFLLVAFLGHFAVAGLDSGRYHWAPPVPAGVQLTGLAALTAALCLATWAVKVNRFLSSVVRIQTERGHHLVTAGPYAWVRHPTYAAALVLLPASGIALGSWTSVPVTLPIVGFLIYRTVTEDAFLKENLTGYREYAQRVRHRLIPGVW